MDADPRGSASGEMPVANSVPKIVTCFDPFRGTRRRARARGNGCHPMGSEWHIPTDLGSLRIPLRSYQSYSAGLTGRGSTSR